MERILKGASNMAGRTTAKRQAYSHSNTRQSQMYVYGNTVTKPAYEPKQRTPKPRQPEKVSTQVKKNRRKALHMSKSYVVFLAAAAILALVVCVNYVQLQSQITSRSKNITVLQEKLASMKEENNTKYNVVMDSVNLEEVRTKAMNDLGMTYAGKDQIVEYDNPTGDYVKQYEQIPEDGVIASSKDVQN